MVGECTSYDLNAFKIIETCFMAQNMIILVNIPYALEKIMYSAWAGISSFYSLDISQVPRTMPGIFCSLHKHMCSIKCLTQKS